MTCPLCLREQKTKLYHEDDKVWIVDDENLDGANVRILAALKEHKRNPSGVEKAYLINALINKVILFQEGLLDGNWRIEQTLRSCPAHYHVHFRVD